MKYMSAVHSDIGIKKSKNQDSMCLKIASIPSGEVALMVVCDGMGGLKKGELASATVIRTMSQWFENNLPNILKNGFSSQQVKEEWEKIIKENNEIINDYGESYRIQLGTTITSLLIVGDEYVIGQVGDSRAYKLSDKIEQITEDQTVVQRDINLGILTEEEGRKDPRQNVLLQCIGASRVVEPVFQEGKITSGQEILLCSDGFRHLVEDDEIFAKLSPELMLDEKEMKNGLIELVELNKSRKEKDNITAMLIKAI